MFFFKDFVEFFQILELFNQFWKILCLLKFRFFFYFLKFFQIFQDYWFLDNFWKIKKKKNIFLNGFLVFKKKNIFWIFLDFWMLKFVYNIFLGLFVFFFKLIWEASQKKSNCKLFPKGWGEGQPQILHLIKSIFWQINKKIRNIFKKVHILKGEGGSRLIWKKFTFWIFYGVDASLRLLLKVNKVSTGHQKLLKIGEKSIIGTFLAWRANKFPWQEVKVGPRSGLYLLVPIIVQMRRLSFYCTIFSMFLLSLRLAPPPQGLESVWKG